MEDKVWEGGYINWFFGQEKVQLAQQALLKFNRNVEL